MRFIEAVDIIETDEGWWDIQLRDSLTIIGCVWHTGAGFIAWDWADRQVGVFDTMPHAVGALSALDGAR